MIAWHDLFISKNYKPALCLHDLYLAFTTVQIEVYCCLMPQIDFDRLICEVNVPVESECYLYLFFVIQGSCQCLICVIKCFVCACIITYCPEKSLVLGILLILKIDTLH